MNYEIICIACFDLSETGKKMTQRILGIENLQSDVSFHNFTSATKGLGRIEGGIKVKPMTIFR